MKIEKEQIAQFKPIAQIDRKAIICSLCTSTNETILLIIDQHAADERIKLEHLLKNFEENGMLASTSCNVLTAIESKTLAASREFKEFGFYWHEGENGKAIITSVPSALSPNASKNTITKYFLSLSTQLSERLPNAIADILKTRACRDAIKFGDKLTIEQCKNLISQLSKCTFPFQCAHGRPTTRILTIIK